MRRKVGLILVFGAALPLAAASVAWACGVLATVTLSKKVAAPGDVVTVTGKNWSTSSSFSPVSIRLQSRTGTVLTTTPVLSGNVINDTLTLPSNLSPGWYVVLGTQVNTSTGVAKSGTPGRTTIRIQGSSSGGAVATPWSSAKPAGPAAATAAASGDGSLLTLMLAAGLSLTMLAGGWTILSRRTRTLAKPQFG